MTQKHLHIGKKEPKCSQTTYIPVGRALGSIDQLICKALSNGFDVPESALPGTSGEEVDGLVHPPQGGDIHSLPPHNTSRTNTGGILTGSTARQ